MKAIPLSRLPDSDEDVQITVGDDHKIHVDATEIDLNGASKSLVTHGALTTALQTFVTAVNLLMATKLDGGGSPGTLTIDISSAATTTVKTGG